MTILYRILGLIINVVAVIITISLVGSIPLLISSPLTMLSGFLMVSIVLYSWFSLQFHKKVLQQQQVVKKSLRDWIRVNGIVGLVFSAILIMDAIFLIPQPQVYIDAIKSYGFDVPIKSLLAFFIAMLLYGICLASHIVWTFILMKKFSVYFQE